MENLAIPKFPVLFAAVVGFILLLTVGLAYMSGGRHADMLLAAAILIALVVIARKVLFMSAENKPE